MDHRSMITVLFKILYQVRRRPDALFHMTYAMWNRIWVAINAWEHETLALLQVFSLVEKRKSNIIRILYTKTHTHTKCICYYVYAYFALEVCACIYNLNSLLFPFKSKWNREELCMIFFPWVHIWCSGKGSEKHVLVLRLWKVFRLYMSSV